MSASPPDAPKKSRSSLRVVGVPRLPPRMVRISLTDRCDLACVYCRASRSDGYLERRLEGEAWETMVRALARAGVRRVRITGGEPLLHPRILERVAFVASVGFDDVALTTNATRLAPLARRLRDAGLRRLTVSLDSLVPARFAEITRGGQLGDVLAGVDAALAAGFDELKTNTVVLRGKNDDELPDIVTWSSARGITPRFIELMRIGEGARLPRSALVGASEMRERLAHLIVEEEGERDPDRGPAKYVRLRADSRQRVGFITGTTDTFCATCDRLRVAADGMLRPCLATNEGVAGMVLAHAGDVVGLVGAIEDAWALKPDGESWKGCTEPTAAEVSMRAIGG